MFKVFYINRKNPNKLIKEFSSIFLSLIILSFFYQIIWFIFGVLDIILSKLDKEVLVEKSERISSEKKSRAWNRKKRFLGILREHFETNNIKIEEQTFYLFPHFHRKVVPIFLNFNPIGTKMFEK